MNMAQNELAVQVPTTGKRIILVYTDSSLIVKHSETTYGTSISFRHVLNATFAKDSRVLKVSYLTKKKGLFTLVKVEGELKDAEGGEAEEWVEKLMHAAYEGVGVKRYRRLRVLINPHGGTRKARLVFLNIVEPILRSAGCTLDATFTTHGGHAYEIAKEFSLDYDAVVTVSGDGLVHEVINGFAHHKTPLKAFSIPISPIPAGSGNGLSLNLLGIKEGLDVSAAALNAIKGSPMKVDIFSLTQNGKRTFSFMSQALGLMADLDIGTEHLRWMGDSRFMFGLIRGIIQLKPCPVQLSIKVAEKDKVKMAEMVQRRQQSNRKPESPFPGSGQDPEESLPPLKYLPHDEEGWLTVEEPLLYVYAGKGPYVGRDFMAFPVSLPDDGLIDVMAQPVSSRREILSEMGGAAKGEAYWNPSLQYFKAHAYRIKPLSPKGYLAVDGELFPWREYQVEVHEGLATLLSPHGYYAADFQVPPRKGLVKQISRVGKQH